MIRTCLLLLAGVYALQLSSFAESSDLQRVGLVAFGLGIIAARPKPVLVMLAGAALFLTDALSVIETRIDSRYVGDSIVAQVRIADFPKRTGDKLGFVAEPIGNPRLPPRLRLSWYRTETNVHLGEVWELELRLRRPRGASNPGGFDAEAWLLRERIGAVGYVVSGTRNRLLDTQARDVSERLRQRAVDRIVAVVDDAGHAAVLAAISVGARHLITSEQWQRYARTGTSHLMAISGLHVGLAAAGGYLLVTLLTMRLPKSSNRHVIATIGAVIVATGYAALSGFAVPAQRASLMIGLAAAAVAARRPVLPAAVIATTCTIVIGLWPLASMAPGFKLSFAAVAVLLWLARRYRGRPRPRGRWLLQAMHGLAAAQLALLLGLLPLTVLEFGRVAFVAPVVNAVAVPIFSFVTVPCALIGVVLDGVLAPAGDRALLIAALSLAILEDLIQLADQLPAAAFTTPRLTPAAWFCVCMPLAWIALPPGWPGRSVAFVAIGALLLYAPPRPPPGCVDVAVLDVGQGLAVVATTRRHALVYDTGPAYRSGASAAASVVLPYLTYRNVDKLDALVVSHADLDHAGGVTALLDSMQVEQLWSGESLPDTGSPARRCAAGETWRYDDVQFEFVHPMVDKERDGNDASCVLLITAGSHRILLPGDIERPAERALVQGGRLLPATAVIVPHHGSLTSSSLPFVAALRPAYAVVSARHGNRWDLPRPEVVTRWQNVGAEVLTTSTSGAVSMRLCAAGGLTSVTRHRRAQRRIWHE